MTDTLFQQRIVQEEQARLAAYKLANEYYDGRQRAMLAVKVGKPDDNLRINFYRYIVDKGVSFLFGKDLTWQIQEGADTPAEVKLAAVWLANRKMSFLHNVALNGGKFGHVFVKLVPRDGQPTRLVNLDPALIRPFWNPDDLADVLYYKIEYEALTPEGQVFKKQLITRSDAGTTWEIVNYEKRGTSYADWQQVSAETWPYPFAPIVDWQNLPDPNTYFGQPDISTCDEQDTINFAGSNIKRILRFHGHPKTWGSGFRAKELEIGPDELVILPSAEAKLQNLEMQSDLASSLGFFDRMRNLFLRTHRIPDFDPAQVNVGALSGFALKILYGDLLELTETKRRTYGDGLVELNRRLQILEGIPNPQPTKLTWQSPLPENKQEQSTELQTEQNLGVISKQTTAQQLGLDWETEQARLQEEALQGNSIGAQLLNAFNRGAAPE